MKNPTAFSFLSSELYDASDLHGHHVLPCLRGESPGIHAGDETSLTIVVHNHLIRLVLNWTTLTM